MIRIEIREAESGRRIDRFIKILLPKVPASFLHRALRENKIKINRRKPKSLAETLSYPATVELFFTDDQLRDFGYQPDAMPVSSANKQAGRNLKILYEDSQLLIVDKPVGIAVQKGPKDPVSLTEIALDYLQAQGETKTVTYRPSFCHRLDKNTGGALVMAKTLEAHHAIDNMLKGRALKKYYLAIAEGNPVRWENEVLLRHLYEKDPKRNMAFLKPFDGTSEQGLTENDHQKTVVSCNVRKLCALTGGKSLLKVELLSGKSHQIRSQLAFEGFPLAGDPKYGNGTPGKSVQMLLAYELFFEDPPDPLRYLKGKRFYASIPANWPVPKDFVLED